MAADQTELTFWAPMPGVTATVEGHSVELDDEGGVLLVEPGLRTTTTTVVLTRDLARVELPLDWSLDYEASHLDPDTLLERLTVRIGPDTGGDCITGMTNGLAGGRAWAGDGLVPAPCGPFTDAL